MEEHSMSIITVLYSSAVSHIFCFKYVTLAFYNTRTHRYKVNIEHEISRRITSLQSFYE